MVTDDIRILWRKVDEPGHESARLYYKDSSWHLEGTAVFAYKNFQPCRLEYLIIANDQWETQKAQVSGWTGVTLIDLTIEVSPNRIWLVNGKECPRITGCYDIDLNFSPSTNLLSIRRLNLSIEKEAKVQSAWLHFPNFTFEPLEQVYRRIDANTYHYETSDGFSANLKVEEHGFVVSYPKFWEAIAIS